MKIDLSFAHSWTAEVLAKRPLILPSRQFVYPAQVEEVELGALEVQVRPAEGAPFLATCALGFADPAAVTGLWSCPHPDWLCAVSGGYAYLMNTLDPKQWQQVEYRPVLEVRAIAGHDLLLFAGHHSLTAWGREGKSWQTGRLSWEGVRIDAIEGNTLTGTGWDLMTDTDVSFRVNLLTGEHVSGSAAGA